MDPETHQPHEVTPVEKPILPNVEGYEIVSQLGKSKTAVVYEGKRTNGQEVAIKVVKPRKEMIQRLKNEARLAPQLEHKHILPIIDVVEDTFVPGKGAYDPQRPEIAVITQRIHGKTLHELMLTDDVTPEEADRYIEELSEAVDYINDHNVLHRDIKPSNILIRNSDKPRGKDDPLRSGRSVVVSDFGVATDQPIKPDQAYGTPPYISPETVRREVQPGGREVWPVGLIAFELYMGDHLSHRKFNSEMTAPAFNSTDEMVQYMEQQNGLPHEAYEAVKDKYGKATAEVFNKVFQNKPEDRYATATEFARALKSSKSSQA